MDLKGHHDLKELQKEYLTKLREVTLEKIRKGALIETLVSQDEGLVLTNGRNQKPKKLIVINVDKDNNKCYGALLVNTNMNSQAKYSHEYLAAQYLLKHEDYPAFLKYDSYADCSELFCIPLDKLLGGQYFEQLTQDDETGIFDLL